MADNTGDTVKIKTEPEESPNRPLPPPTQFSLGETQPAASNSMVDRIDRLIQEATSKPSTLSEPTMSHYPVFAAPVHTGDQLSSADPGNEQNGLQQRSPKDDGTAGAFPQLGGVSTNSLPSSGTLNPSYSNPDLHPARQGYILGLKNGKKTPPSGPSNGPPTGPAKSGPSGPKANEVKNLGLAMVELNNAAQKKSYRQAIDVYRKVGSNQWFGTVYIGNIKAELRDSPSYSEMEAKRKVISLGLEKLRYMEKGSPNMLHQFPQAPRDPPFGYTRGLSDAPRQSRNTAIRGMAANSSAGSGERSSRIIDKIERTGIKINFVSLIFEFYNIHQTVMDRPEMKVSPSDFKTTAILTFKYEGKAYSFMGDVKSGSPDSGQDAKQDCAKKAIVWLLDSGHLSEIDSDGHIRATGSKRPASVANLEPLLSPPPPPMRPAVEADSLRAPVVMKRSASDNDTGSWSYVQAAAKLADVLGYSEPVYYWIPTDPIRSPSSMFDCSAHLVEHERDGIKGAAVAQLKSHRVDNGAKEAHEAIAKELYRWLDALRTKKSNELAEQMKRLKEPPLILPY